MGTDPGDAGTAATGEVRVVDAPGRSRYEATLDGEPAGFSAYLLSGTTITFTHTEVDPRFEGRGIGSTLVGHAVADARARGLHVVALCPFVRAWVARHRAEP